MDVSINGGVENGAADRSLPSVTLFTDGACIGNPGPGGWAYILRHPVSGRSKEGSGGEHGATNNRMEILAVIRGLEALKAPSVVELFSDSDYVVSAITDWMGKWKAFGWRKTVNAKAMVRNADLWRRLDELLQLHRVTARWVRGHNGHAENEWCDQLATAAAARVAATPAPPPPAPSPVDTGLFGSAATDEDVDGVEGHG
jgi:ribonuclease HI